MIDENRGKKIFGAIGLVVAVVILVAISALIVSSLFSTSVFIDVTTTGLNSNETLTNVTNITTQDFAILSTFSGASCTLTEVWNASEAISSGNYTQPTSCQILATADSSFIGDNWNVSYTFINTEFATIGGVNVSLLGTGFGLFITGMITFLGIIGIILGIVWLISYLRPLFSKEEGIQSFSGS